MLINIKSLSKKPLLSLVRKNKYHYKLGNLLIQYIRTALNKIKWEDNRQFSAIQQRQNRVPKNVQQANKLFIATQQNLSLSQRARMQRIDNILGTNTYFHQTKIYQERLDSDHIMDLQQLKRQHKQKSRKILDWQNPKADLKIKYKNKKRYYQFISTLRTYPKHQPKYHDFNDEINQNTIQFLASETVYSKISLKPIEITMQSIQTQLITNIQRPFQSQKYYYFRPQFTMQLFRIQKAYYRQQMLRQQKIFNNLQQHLQQIISLDEIYEILKEYDEDERVSEYLKKVQNNRIQYLLSYFTYDSSQNMIAVMIDLLGNQKQYCLIVKNINLFKDKSYGHKVIFNTRPNVAFTHDGLSICYIQRSQEGGWIQLVQRSSHTCWFKKQSQLINLQGEEQQSQQIIYKCSPEKQMQLGSDTNKNYIFLTIRQHSKVYSQHLFILNIKNNQITQNKQIQLIELDKSQKVKYYYDVSPLGIIYAKFQPVQSYLKYGQNSQTARQIFLIPFKQHLMLHTNENMGLSQTFLTGKVQTKIIHPPTQFDTNNKKIIFVTKQNQYIKTIQTRLTHLILTLNIYSIYNKSILYFLPFKETAHPHSIIFRGAQLQLRKNTYNYNSQIVQFTKKHGCLSIQKIYNIWKRQLTDFGQNLYKYHFQNMVISKQGEYPLEISILCKSLYVDDKDLPVVLYFATSNQQIEESCLRKSLEKGIMIVQFLGRGTFSKDLEHFMLGSQENIENMFNDFQEVIQFIGNNLSKNISLYCKGQISSLVGLWFNVYFPFLFNSSVLHNGFYDFQDVIQLKKLQYFFGNLQSNTQEGVLFQERKQRMNKRLQRFNIFAHSFRLPFLRTETIDQKKVQVGTLENIIISSDKHHRVHSRKLIYRLRENKDFKYQQVYLKEYENDYQADLFNLSYIYSHIRTRLQTQINTPQEQAQDDNPKQNNKP